MCCGCLAVSSVLLLTPGFVLVQQRRVVCAHLTSRDRTRSQLPSFGKSCRAVTGRALQLHRVDFQPFVAAATLPYVLPIVGPSCRRVENSISIRGHS